MRLDTEVLIKRFEAPDEVREMTLGRFDDLRAGEPTSRPRPTTAGWWAMTPMSRSTSWAPSSMRADLGPTSTSRRKRPVRHGAALLLAAVAVIGCAAREGADVSGGDSSQATASSDTGGGLTSRGWDSDCPIDTVPRHSDPVALVEEFVRRDAQGPFEREDLAREWHDGALTCIERNTSDDYEVIIAFRVEPLESRDDTARVLVHRTRAFKLDQDRTRTRLVDAPAEWTDTVVVVRTPWEWRIDRLHPGAHRLPARALQELRGLSAADSARLRALVPRTGS